MGLIALLLTCALIHPVQEIEGSSLRHGQMHDAGVLPMLIYFSSDDCSACTQFDAMFEEPEILKKMEQRYVSVKVSIDDIDGKACADIYHVKTVPAFVIADHEGIILYKSDATLSVVDIQLLFDAVPGKFPSIKPPESLSENDSSVIAQYSTGTPQSNTPDNLPGEEPEMQNNASVVIAEARVHIPESSVTVNSKAPAIETPAIQRATVNSSPDNNRVNTKAEITKVSVKIGDAHEQHKSVIKKEEIPVASARKKPLSTKHTYSVQLGFFSEAPNAKTLTQKAKLKGLAEVRTETELRDGKSYYRVLIGSFSTLTEAQTLLGKVHSFGFKAAVHRQ